MYILYISLYIFPSCCVSAWLALRDHLCLVMSYSCLCLSFVLSFLPLMLCVGFLLGVTFLLWCHRSFLLRYLCNGLKIHFQFPSAHFIHHINKDDFIFDVLIITLVTCFMPEINYEWSGSVCYRYPPPILKAIHNPITIVIWTYSAIMLQNRRAGLFRY